MKIDRVLLSCVIFGLVGPNFVYANSVEQANRELIRIQQDLQERAKIDREKIIQPMTEPTKLDIKVPQPKAQLEGPCITINEIKVSGVTILALNTINKIINPYNGTCLGAVQIEQIMGDITAAYIQKGYITTRVYLPEQDLKSGFLKINIVEGKVGSIKIKKGAEGTVNLSTAAPFIKGNYLNLKDLEQATDQINRLSSNHATMEVQPGDVVGESIIVFDNKPTRRITGALDQDNHGQKSTGKTQAGLRVNIDNPFKLNDLLSVSYRRSLPFTQNKQDSYSTNLIYAVPFGYQLLSLSASRSNYDSTLSLIGGDLHASGITNNYNLNLERLFWKEGNSQLRANISFTHKDNENFLEDLKLDVSSRKLSILDFGLAYSTYIGDASVRANVSASHGLKALSALNDEENLPNWAPKAQFTKYNYGLSIFKPLNINSYKFSLSSQISGQISQDTLYGSEQFSIGSNYSVRGFNESSLSGDEGFFIKNDFSYDKSIFLNNFNAFTRTFVGVDYGNVKNQFDNKIIGDLTSISLGSSLFIGPWKLDLLVTQPVNYPSYMENPGTSFFFMSSVAL